MDLERLRASGISLTSLGYARSRPAGTRTTMIFWVLCLLLQPCLCRRDISTEDEHQLSVDKPETCSDNPDWCIAELGLKMLKYAKNIEFVKYPKSDRECTGKEPMKNDKGPEKPISVESTDDPFCWKLDGGSMFILIKISNTVAMAQKPTLRPILFGPEGCKSSGAKSITAILGDVRWDDAKDLFDGRCVKVAYYAQGSRLLDAEHYRAKLNFVRPKTVPGQNRKPKSDSESESGSWCSSVWPGVIWSVFWASCFTVS